MVDLCGNLCYISKLTLLELKCILKIILATSIDDESLNELSKNLKYISNLAYLYLDSIILHIMIIILEILE